MDSQLLLDNHPVVFTILAFPVVLTVCVVVLTLFGVEFTWKK